MADHGGPNYSQMPLQGVVLCCTSIVPEKRSELVFIAAQMGATHKLDLTSDVTHLLVGDTNTPKYKYVARQREDVKVLKPEWVEAVRQSWILGGETDVEKLEAEYRLPALEGCRISITGFSDLEFRQTIEATITESGGIYSGDLAKTATHLIACVAEGAKYRYANMWGLHIVSIEWLRDSLKRGMVLDEGAYNLDIPEEEKGKGAWVRRTVSTTTLGKRPREASDSVGRSMTRKLRRTASVKLQSQNQSIWSDIVTGGSSKPTEHHDQWEEEEEDLKAKKVHTDSEGEGDANTGSGAMPTAPVWHEDRIEDQVQGLESLVDSKPGEIFYGKSFLLHGFTDRQTQVLRNSLESYDAMIIPDPSSLSMLIADAPDANLNIFVVVSHRLPISQLPTFDISDDLTFVTEMWVENCIFSRSFVPPSSSVPNKPFFKSKIPLFESMTLSSTGILNTHLLHLSKAVTLAGGTFTDNFSQKTSVLVCSNSKPTVVSDKRRYAHIWNVPVVSEDWLWNCICTEQVLPFEEYLMPSPSGIETGGGAQRTSNSTAAETKESSGEQEETFEMILKKTSRHLHRVDPIQVQAAKSRLAAKQTPKTKTKADSQSDGDAVTAISKARIETESKQEDIGLAATSSFASIVEIDGDAFRKSTRNQNQNQQLQPAIEDKKDGDEKKLNKIPPNPNPGTSPPAKQPTTSSTKAISLSSPKKPTPTAPPKPATDPTISATISALLAHKKSKLQRTASLPTGTVVDLPNHPRRHRALLGRATSNLSAIANNLFSSNESSSSINATASSREKEKEKGKSKRDPLSRTSSLTSNLSSISRSHSPESMAMEMGDRGLDAISMEAAPSTQLGYEDPEADKARRLLLQRMGVEDGNEDGGLGDGRRKVEVAGTLRDEKGERERARKGGKKLRTAR
ncbi:MAG: hypothetical protein M1834_009367 [Cirrosporium novae-zelandiae]|nr:MAG: hypothetical protein M1834_009367 [Cirrosporium novae-zelandiae]